MVEFPTYCTLPGQLLVVGTGAITRGVLPLILRHLKADPKAITLVSPDPQGQQLAATYGVTFVEQTLTPQNYRAVLEPRLSPTTFLLNLSVNVSSLALIELCQEKGALYLDSCIEPWSGGYTDAHTPVHKRTNYSLREEALALRRRFPEGPTAVLAHGANPGLVSHLVKQALMQIATDTQGSCQRPQTRAEWAALMQQLGVKVVHVAERDSQVASKPKERGEFVNTWSVDGFVSEGSQPAEMGWGSHERQLPADGERHPDGCGAAIFLNRPGASVKIRSWTPKEGPYQGFLITHNEAISIADYFTVHEQGRVTFRPTVLYAYHPCDDAVKSIHELSGKNWQAQPKSRILLHEIIGGTDELGVLLMGHAQNAYWYGSHLSTDQARELTPHNSATTLQVTSSVLAGIAWAIRHPRKGIVEAEDMDYQEVIDMARPYLGELSGSYTDWTPLRDLQHLFPASVDHTDPWQFQNFVTL